MLKISINKRAFVNILNNKKKIEGRLSKGIFSKISIGDIFTFYNNNESCDVEIIKINYYNNFYDMLSNENLRNLLPYCNNIISINTKAAIDSTIGIALFTTHGSCLPFTEIVVFLPN